MEGREGRGADEARNRSKTEAGDRFTCGAGASNENSQLSTHLHRNTVCFFSSLFFFVAPVLGLTCVRVCVKDRVDRRCSLSVSPSASSFVHGEGKEGGVVVVVRVRTCVRACSGYHGEGEGGKEGPQEGGERTWQRRTGSSARGGRRVLSLRLLEMVRAGLPVDERHKQTKRRNYEAGEGGKGGLGERGRERRRSARTRAHGSACVFACVGVRVCQGGKEGKEKVRECVRDRSCAVAGAEEEGKRGWWCCVATPRVPQMRLLVQCRRGGAPSAIHTTRAQPCPRRAT